jgi:hypothetical protein
MKEADRVRLVALDEEDLAVISAHVQDAVLKASDLLYLPKESRFVLAMNRFAWETAAEGKRNYERRRAALTFDRVLSVKTQKIDRDGDAVLDLLAVEFAATDAPAGMLDLVFAGGATVRLEVECIEARLSDLGPAWAAGTKPDHDKPDPPAPSR